METEAARATFVVPMLTGQCRSWENLRSCSRSSLRAHLPGLLTSRPCITAPGHARATPFLLMLQLGAALPALWGQPERL